jgi:hypothetical protein
MSQPRCAGVVLTAALAAQLVVGGGCGGPDTGVPKTYPAKGKVVFPDGQPLTGGMVEFRSAADASLTTTGEIRPDGTFSLSTLVGTKKVPGAVAGEHRVTVLPPQGPDQAAQPVTLPKPYTVRPGDDNDFTITIEKPRR